MLKIQNLSKKFKRKTVLNDINLTIDNGIYGLIGPNGSGKTTLMRCITDLYDYKGGIALLDEEGKQIKTKGNVGYLPQTFGLFPDAKLYDAMMYFASLYGLSTNESKERVEECLEIVNLLEKKDSKVGTLSGGMVRRVGIAQALISKPKLLLLDEPTVGLDVEEKLRFKMIFAKIKKDCSIIISSHISSDIEDICSDVIVMDKGNVLKTCSVSELKEMAMGKVKVVDEEVLNRSDSLYVVSMVDSEGKKQYRVVASKLLEGTEVEPTFEDGYLCVLKDI